MNLYNEKYLLNIYINNNKYNNRTNNNNNKR